jgi:hypothetical protein
VGAAATGAGPAVTGQGPSTRQPPRSPTCVPAAVAYALSGRHDILPPFATIGGGKVDGTRLFDIIMGAIFGGGLSSTWLQLRHQRRIERNERREKYAGVLIDTQALIDVTTAIRYITTFRGGLGPDKVKEWEASVERVRTRVSGPLMRLAHTHPSAQVRELAEQLTWETGTLLSLDPPKHTYEMMHSRWSEPLSCPSDPAPIR